MDACQIEVSKHTFLILSSERGPKLASPNIEILL